jgi:peptidoglycan/xylan/chitin deacetylase (PgdA/CDA1 family)
MNGVERFPRGGAGAKVLVLAYHAISERWPTDVAVTPSMLERQLTDLVRSGFRGLTFTEAVTETHDAPVLAVTFDDSYGSMFEYGYPILAELGIPGTVFVPTDYARDQRPRSWPNLDRWLDGQWAGELAGADWEQIGKLAEAGWEIGSHGRSHIRLSELDDQVLKAELEDSRRSCEEHTGTPCRSVAYPYGDHDDRVIQAARDAGYVTGATIAGRLTPQATADVMCWPRLGINRHDHGLRLRAKAQLYRNPRAWNLSHRLRRNLSRRRGRDSTPRAA